jgi:hypothetical protein
MDRKLDAVHDFFEHSRIVWWSFQKFVDEGHQIVAENPATGSHLAQNAHGFLPLATIFAAKLPLK